MHRTQPFARFHAVMAAMAGLLAATVPSGAVAASREQALSMAGGYSSPGKTGSRPHDRGGNRRFQRQALKRRNQRRNRLAHR